MNEGYHLVACCGAFVVAMGSYWRSTRSGRPRFVLAVSVGAMCAFVGQELLFDASAWADSRARFRLEGASMLFVPLGLLLVAPFQETLATLPLALFVARLGCLPYSCCYGAPGDALVELAGLLLLHLSSRRWPERTTLAVLSGFGLARLLSTPLRAELGAEPLLDPAWVAGLWIVAGVVLRNRIGPAEEAAEWFSARLIPLVQSLWLVLVVSLMFPLSRMILIESEWRFFASCSAATALVVALRSRCDSRSFTAGIPVFCAGLVLAGAAVVMGDYLLAQFVGGRAIGASGVLVGLATTPGGSSSALWVFSVVALAPCFEELLFRERIQRQAELLWGGFPAVALSSGLFAIYHIDLDAMALPLFGGVIAGTVMLRTRSLPLVIGLHAGHNLVFAT